MIENAPSSTAIVLAVRFDMQHNHQMKDLCCRCSSQQGLFAAIVAVVSSQALCLQETCKVLY